MVKKIFHFFHKEISGLHQAAYLLAFFAFLSQILALVRDRTLAHVFGASHILDIYYAAFRIPDFIFVSVGSMVSISVLVPFFVEKMEKNFDEAKQFIGNVFSIFFITITLVAIVTFFLVPTLVPWVLPGFAHDPLKPELIMLIRIFLLSPILLGLSNFFASITQLYNRFLLYALSPLFYNIGIIIGALFLYPVFGIAGLGYGVALGALMHVTIQIPFTIEQKIFPHFSFRINFSAIKKVVLLSFPRTLTLSSNQISTFFLIAIASFMTAGSISIFNFAFNLQSVPLSIIGVSYTSAAFPMLSKLFSSGNRQKFIEQMAVSSRHIIFWSTPAMILFVVLRAQIVRVILGSGKFNWADTRLTAACVAVFTLSIIPQSLIILFVRSYYSGGQTKKPMYINLFSSTLIVVLGYGLVKLYTAWPFFHYFIESLFKIDGLDGTIVLMLPLAYSIGVLVNTILHWVAFERDFRGYSKPVLDTFFQVFSASIIMGYFTFLMLSILSKVFNLNTVAGVLLQGFLSGIVGIIVCIIVLKLLKNPEIDEIWSALHSKIWKAKVIVPDQEVL